ncbi:MAG: copper resistance CopC family protein [Stackebrandtia sp.]
MKTLRIIAAALATAALYTAATASPAYAHARLLSSDPEAGERLAEAPEELVLEFSEPIDLDSTSIVVNNAADENVAEAAPTVDDNVVTQPVTLPEAGEYTLGYQIVSVDGHPVDGTISFAVESVPEANQTESDAAQTQKPEETDEAGDAASDSELGWGPVLAAAAALAALGAGAIFLLRRRRAARD